MKELSPRLQKMRMWAIRHRAAIRFTASFLHFMLASIFFFSALSAFMPLGDQGVRIMAGVILLMIAAFFWKNATDFSDWGQEPEDTDEAISRIDAELDDLRKRINVIEYLP